MKKAIPVFAAVFGLCGGEASAIIIRDDVPDARYLAYASETPPVVHLDLLGPGRAAQGMGVLIAPQWILTAGHVARDTKTGHKVVIAGETYEVAATAVHPDFDSKNHDIGLVRLSHPAPQNLVTPIYRKADEAGAVIRLAGMGDVGTGLTGPTRWDRLLRAADNRVDQVDSVALVFRFDGPKDRGVMPLEGISGPGDSGGPAFIRRGGSWFVAGISSGQDASAVGGARGRYGVTEFYARVSTAADWIDGVLKTGQ